LQLGPDMDHVFIDSTFTLAPPLFSQVFVILAKRAEYCTLLPKGPPKATVMYKHLAFTGSPTAVVKCKHLAFKGAHNSSCNV